MSRHLLTVFCERFGNAFSSYIELLTARDGFLLKESKLNENIRANS